MMVVGRNEENNFRISPQIISKDFSFAFLGLFLTAVFHKAKITGNEQSDANSRVTKISLIFFMGAGERNKQFSNCINLPSYQSCYLAKLRTAKESFFHTHNLRTTAV